MSRKLRFQKRAKSKRPVEMTTKQSVVKTALPLRISVNSEMVVLVRILMLEC
jgi:hypothetical protein